MNSTSASMAFSAIIPVKNQPEHLTRLLDSFEKHAPVSLLPEIIVVDDASEADIGGIVQRYPRVRYICLDAGRGPAAARNKGAEIAACAILFFFDADVICPPGLFEKAAAILSERPDCAAVSFLNQEYDAQASDIANYHALIEGYWFLSLLGADCAAGSIRGFMTRGGAIRKEAFLSIFGFDARYKTNAHEDYDFGKRLCARYLSLMARTPRIYHCYPDSLWRFLRNIWVRTLLFVPYYLAHWPCLDTAQASRGEALLRLTGVGSGALACAMIFPVPFRSLGLAVAATGLTGYIWAISKLLKNAWHASGRIGFVLKFMAIHYVSSVVIATAACLALATWPFAKPPHELLSPIESSKHNASHDI